MSETTEVLKACPFCGQTPELFNGSYPDTSLFSVRCSNYDCIMAVETEESRKADVIAEWNTRAPSPGEAELRAELAAAIALRDRLGAALKIAALEAEDRSDDLRETWEFFRDRWIEEASND